MTDTLLGNAFSNEPYIKKKKKVYMTDPLGTPYILQFPKKDYIWGDYEFQIGGECEECDFVVVLDRTNDSIKTRCCKSHIVYFPMETASMRKYPKRFFDSFETVFCFQPKLLKMKKARFSIFPCPWMVLNSFSKDYKNGILDRNLFSEVPASNNRINKFCLITSNKKYTRGHCDRINFALKIKELLPDIVDIFGYGFNEIDIKEDVLKQYKYSIVIENDLLDNYRTEKLQDALLAGCYPLYYGDPQISELIDKNAFMPINIFNISECVDIILSTLKNNTYEKQNEAILKARDYVLFKWNTFNIIAECLDTLPVNGEKENIIIPPIQYTKFEDRIRYLKTLFYTKLPYGITKYFTL